VLGGGGYNPWTVGRLWAGVWGVLNDHDLPDRLPIAAEAIQRDLSWGGKSRGRPPQEALFTTLRDAPRPGPIRPEIRHRVSVLRGRLSGADRPRAKRRTRTG